MMESDSKPVLTQKEYLKRYLSKDKNKKKKKKPTISSSSHIKRSVIIDDDLGLKDVANVDDEEFNLDYLGDEAPQIAGIVDERPTEIRAKEKYDSNLWRTVGDTNNDGNSPQNSNKHSELTRIKINLNSDDLNGSDSGSLPRFDKTKTVSSRKNTDSEKYERENSNPPLKKKDRRICSNDSDLSPERSNDRKKKDRKKHSSDSDLTPERSRERKKRDWKKHGSESDISPERNRDGKGKNLKKRSSDSDLSPERSNDRKKKDRKKHSSDSDLSPERNNDKKKKDRKRYNNESDLSPERNSDRKKRDRKRNSSESDMSPERNRNRKKKESNSDSDMSPPRTTIRKNSSYRDSDVSALKNKDRNRGKRDFIPNKINHNFDHRYKARKKSNTDEESDTDLLHMKKMKHEGRDKYREKEYQYRRDDGKSHHGSVRDDSSKQRDKEKRKSERSPVHSGRKYHDELELPLKSHKPSRSSRTGGKKDSDSDLSPARNHSQSRKKKEKSNYRAEAHEKMQDGKKSGLQDAKHLKEELKRLKANEDKMFKKMDPSMLGAMAAPIQRDRKTGMVKQMEKEKEEDRVKAEKRAQTENKYYKWGKGLKQIQDQEDRISDAIHEMSKPLARYRDDKDLDAYLRAQEREGDPMLEFIRSNQAESHNVIDLTLGSTKPMYNGSYMPNRYGIRPGYRWDGVDRSNGYEKRWFEQKNARKAVEEAAYKWSTSDM